MNNVKDICSAIEWTDEMSVGIEEFDKQHRQIIDLVNRLIETPDVDTKSESVDEILNEMTRYAREHMRDEEAFLESVGFPSLARHIALHRSYQKQVVGLCVATTKGEDQVPLSLAQLLGDWWMNHILVEDMAYKRFLEERDG